ncbi:protein kinase [bacterium]|nr:protein kinase [bacterium]
MSDKEPVPGYELLEVLGEGGMATVFKARQRATGRICALKVLRQFDATVDRLERRLDRFLQEGDLLERLDHPNVVRILARGNDEAGTWLALEYVDGPSLEELLERQGGPLAPGVVLALLCEVAHALDHLSSRGVVHLDVKPPNIVITAGGAAKLCDFGIAQLKGMNDEVTRDRVISSEMPIGTIDYMAPEQVEGDAVDGRVDIFALGSTAYRCLAGMTPFTGETVFARLRELVERQPPPLPRSVPPSLGAFVFSLLSKEPDERPEAKQVVSSAESLARELLGGAGEGWARRALVEILARPRKPKPAADAPALVILSSDEMTIERPLAVGEGFVIGRSLADGQASTSIGMPWISRQHCRLELGGRGLVVTNLGSSNGTYVNGLKVRGHSSALLRPGDKLTLGKTVLDVALENAPPSLAAPLWKCLLCGIDLPNDAGSSDEATKIEERHLCARCRARMEEDRASGEKRAREAIAALGVSVSRRLELGGPILRFEAEGSVSRPGQPPRQRKLAAHALDLGPSAAKLYVERSKTALSLDHPGLLLAHAVRASEGVLVIVTDPVEARTASEIVLREGVLASETARRATVLLARAVSYARTQGVTSVAIRPGLVLLKPNGQARLMDVGLAPGLVEAGRSRVEMGRSMPSYEAPEAAGVREMTPRALVYSIAAVGHFLLTGEAPLELRSGGRRVTATPLRERNEVPPELARVLDRALQQEPEKRYASLEDLVTALDALAPPAPAVEAKPVLDPNRVTHVLQFPVEESTIIQEDTDLPDPRRTGRFPNPFATTTSKLDMRPGGPASPAPPAPPRKSAPSGGQQVASGAWRVPVDMPQRIQRFARDGATGVLTIRGGRASVRFELAAGKIVRADAPLALALGSLAACLSAKGAATTFEPGATLGGSGPRVELTIADALARARAAGAGPEGPKT